MRMVVGSGAGIEEAPGSVRPIASAIAVIVLAVPMVMQVPWLRAMPASIAGPLGLGDVPARRSSQNFQASEPEPSTLPFQLPRSIGPAGRKIAGRPALIAPIRSGRAWSCRSRPSAPRRRPGCERISSSASIASMLR